jgi:hypothetical protein
VPFLYIVCVCVYYVTYVMLVGLSSCSVCCVSVQAEALCLRPAIAVTRGECSCEVGSVVYMGRRACVPLAVVRFLQYSEYWVCASMFVIHLQVIFAYLSCGIFPM